jgi:hypothetical protein
MLSFALQTFNVIFSAYMVSVRRHMHLISSLESELVIFLEHPPTDSRPNANNKTYNYTPVRGEACKIVRNVSVNPSHRLFKESRRRPIRSDCADAGDGLAEMGVDGGARCRLDSLQLARGRNVESLQEDRI